MESAKNVFSRVGFAQLAGAAAVIPVSFLMVPLANPVSMQKILDTMGPHVLLLMVYVPNLISLLVFWLIIRKLPKADWKTESLGFGKILRIFLMMYAVATLLNLAGGAVSNAAPAGGTEQLDLINSVVNTKLISGFAIVVLIGPLLEELMFRKLMIDRLHDYGESNAILFSALCFGLFHGNLAQFLYAFGVGLFLGYVYCRTRRVTVTFLMHSLLNAFSSSLMLLVPLMQEDGDSAAAAVMLAGLAMVLIIAVMVIAGLILVVIHLKKKDMVPDDSMSSAVPKKDALKTIYFNPGVALLFLVSIAGIAAGLLNLNLNLQLPF